jgi:hypothetical protein
VEITKGESAGPNPKVGEARRSRRPQTMGGARIVSTANVPSQPHSMRLSEHSTIEQVGLQVPMPKLVSASLPGNPLGRRVINPITPYELWGLKHPSLNKKRSNSLEPLG